MSDDIIDLVSRPDTEPMPLTGLPKRNANITAPRRHLLEALARIRYGTLSLSLPDGTTEAFYGSGPGIKARLTLNDWRALDEILARGQMGFADAYIDGLLDTDDLPGLMTLLLVNEALIKAYIDGNPWHGFLMKIVNALHANTKQGSRRNVAAHYDVGNDFFQLWLDKSMTYSCALFDGDPTRTLEDAQAAKYRRILTKLETRPGQTVLDIGCGWGGFAETAARMDLKVTAITLSKAQADYTRKRIEDAGLQNLVRVEVTDYRDVAGEFDRIVSIGMFEHVGEAYWPGYFRTIRQHLKPNGAAMIQTITTREPTFKTSRGQPGFIETYIFPGGRLPSPAIFRAKAQAAGLRCREMFAFGRDYKRTLETWLARFEAKLHTVRSLGYNEPFIRLWRLYFCTCIAAFATVRTGVMQAELIPNT